MIRILSLLVIFAFAMPTWADELKTLAGKTITGTLGKVTSSEIVLTTDAGPISTPLAQALDLNLRPGKTYPAAASYLEVQLLDDSLLRCTKVVFGAKDAQLELTSGASVKVPLAALVTVLRDAHDPDIKKQWDRLLRARTRNDRIFVVRAGDLNSIEGSLGEIDPVEQKIKFKGNMIPERSLELGKIQGMQFVRTDVATEPSLCKIVDVDGNTLVASKLDFAGKKLEVTTPFGEKVGVDPQTVALIDFNYGRLTYLSDLDARIADTPLLGGFTPVRKDVNLDGAEIMLQGKQYAKGLSMYAGAELTYNLGSRYKDFKAVLGADARIAEEGQGKVTLAIYCDNEKRFSEVVSTKALKNIVLSVKDVNTLRIVVTGSNFTNYSGHATLAHAYVSQ